MLLSSLVQPLHRPPPNKVTVSHPRVTSITLKSASLLESDSNDTRIVNVLGCGGRPDSFR